MFRKFTIVALAAAIAAVPLPVLAQGKKDSVVMAMALEPPGLDPTTAAAAAIAERLRPSSSSKMRLETTYPAAPESANSPSVGSKNAANS